MKRILLATLIVAFMASPVFSLTPRDIVELCQAGFEPERIARIVDATGLDEPLEAKDWVYLKSEGCSEELVDALLEVLVPTEEFEEAYDDNDYDSDRADVNVYLGGYNHWGSLYSSRWWYDPFWSVGIYYGDIFWDPYWTPYWYSSGWGYPHYNYSFAWNWGGHHNHHRSYCGPYDYYGGHYNGGYYSGGYHSRYKASRRGSLRGTDYYASAKSYRTVQNEVRSRTRTANVTRATYTVDKRDSKITAGSVTRSTTKARSEGTVGGQSSTTRKAKTQSGTTYTTRKGVKSSSSATTSSTRKVRSKSSGTSSGSTGTESKGSSSGAVKSQPKSSKGSSSTVTPRKASGKSKSSRDTKASPSSPRTKDSGTVSPSPSGSKESGSVSKSSSSTPRSGKKR